jgi:hypothetical protein
VLDIAKRFSPTLAEKFANVWTQLSERRRRRGCVSSRERCSVIEVARPERTKSFGYAACDACERGASVARSFHPSSVAAEGAES